MPPTRLQGIGGFPAFQDRSAVYPATPTFWIEPTDVVAVGLRRYSSGTSLTCEGGYHTATVYTGRDTARFKERDGRRVLAERPEAPHDDPHWPATCAYCDYRFVDEDRWQDVQDLIYRRPDTGEEMTLRGGKTHLADGQPLVPGAPAGAMWDAYWMPDAWRGPDGIALMVRLPNLHDWHVDGRASNCTRPNDSAHACWVRHGDPRTGKVTAGKDGDTCAAGAGSILAGDYHGFLVDGVLSAG